MCYFSYFSRSNSNYKPIPADGYPKPLKYDSVPIKSSSIWLFRGKRIGPYFPFASSLAKSSKLFSGNRSRAMLFLNLFRSNCGWSVNASGYTLINGLLTSIEPTSTRTVAAFWIHSAGVIIHFSFKIAPEQCDGSAFASSVRYLMNNDACHGKSPSFARFPLEIRFSVSNAEFNAIFSWKSQRIYFINRQYTSINDTRSSHLKMIQNRKCSYENH